VQESAIAELTNGSLVITARNGQNHSSSSLCLDGSGEVCRVFARSDTGGQTWGQPWHVPYSMLPASRCEAAMASVDLPGHAAGLLLFGAPMNTTTGDRTNYTVHTSLDGTYVVGCFSFLRVLRLPLCERVRAGLSLARAVLSVS